MKLETNVFALRTTRVAHFATGAGLLALMAMAWMPQTMRAQEGSNPWVLDNVKTGGGRIQGTSGTPSVIQNGSGIIGGERSLTLVFGPNSDPFGQISTAQVRPSADPKVVPPALIWSNGFDTVPGFYVEYFGLNNDTPLNLNLTDYDRLRVSFEGLSTGVVLVAEVWYGGSFQYFAPLSCGLTASTSAFTVDLPFSAFTPGLAPITWNSLDGLLLQFSEGSSPLNSPNLAITGFSALMPRPLTRPRSRVPQPSRGFDPSRVHSIVLSPESDGIPTSQGDCL